MESLENTARAAKNNPFLPQGDRIVCAPDKAKLRLQLVGLGDVGGSLLTGLVLLGGGLIADIGIYDPDACRISRYEQEMNQILPPAPAPTPFVYPLAYQDLFCQCDGMIFTASAGVPPVGSGITDVRMYQLEKNQAILAPYGKLAAETGFTGWFFQVSDPVDLLCNVLKNAGVPKETIIGCGLGVMLARANYCARKHGITDFFTKGRVFGPHGIGLIVANDTGGGYDDRLSQALTRETLAANLSLRETGYKPYIAPGLSSGCITILKALAGDWFDGSVYMDGVFFGRRVRLTPSGIQGEPLPSEPALTRRIQETLALLSRQMRG